MVSRVRESGVQGGSTVVGNRMTDFLREVKFHSEGRGSQYFQPVHIQIIPVRKQVLDINECIYIPHISHTRCFMAVYNSIVLYCIE